MKRILLLFLVIIIAITTRAQNFVWAKQTSYSTASTARTMTVDAAGNVYITGVFSGTTDFDPGAGTFNLTSAGYNDVFVTKLDASGNFVWAKQFGGLYIDGGTSIAVDGSGNVYTTGYFDGTVDFDPGAGTFNLASAGGEPIFICKLDASGNFVWAAQFSGSNVSSTVREPSIAVDPSGNVYTTGKFQYTIDFDPGPGTADLSYSGATDVFVSKLDASGNYVWAKKIGSIYEEYGESIDVDASGNVYTTGIFKGTTDFNPGAVVNLLTPIGAADIFISKLDANGNYVWAKQLGGTTSEFVTSIKVDASANVYTTGGFSGTADFNPGAGTFNLTSYGDEDIFISKLDASGNFVWAKQMGGTLEESGSSIALDASSNVYCNGYFTGTSDFDPGAGTFNLTPTGSGNTFISKLDAFGNFAWAIQFDGIHNNFSDAIALDASDNVYTIGAFFGTVDFDPGVGVYNMTYTNGDNDTYISKLSQVVAPSTIITATSGNWSNPATWVGGVVPTAIDQVIISADHDIILDVSGTARSLVILGGINEANNGSLTINNAANTLTIGDFNTGGGKDSVVVHGTLTITNGSLNIGGRLIQYPYPSDINHSGGAIRIDGNTGVAGSSVADTDYLLRSLNIYNSGYTFSGGQLIFIDPPFGPSGNSMSWTVAGGKYLGTNSELVFGDGVSTTAGGNADGFRLGVYVAGNISINNPSGTNRNVTNLASGMLQANSLNITAGTFNTARNLDVIGTTENNGTLVCTANNLDLRGGLSNNGTVTTSLHLQVDGDVVNNTGASINSTNFYFTKNLTNDGSIGLSNHFSCSRTSLSPSSFAQAISGTGTFNLSTATLRIDNTNAAGVTLNKDLSVSKLALAQGKLYLGNSNITFNTLPVSGGSALSYIVTNGTGRLRFSNLGSSEVLFPIGTATTYNPVKINNGSGHTFSAGVQTGFTTAPPGTEHVNREWDIDDLTGGAVSADVTLQWNTADEDFSFNRNLCAVAHYNGSIWHSLVAASTAANPSPDVYTSIATGVSSFSPFAVSSNTTVLPLKLLSFTAQKETNRVRLSWQTEMETNVSHFEVQRSSDGLNYTNIKTVAASNTMDRYNYSVVDASPLKGLNFYRLRMVDKNDQFKLSHIVKTNFDKAITMSISPNPAKAEISIQCDQAITGISIIDRVGKIVLQFAPHTSNKYAIQSLRPGIYFVKIFSGNTSEVLRLLKE